MTFLRLVLIISQVLFFAIGCDESRCKNIAVKNKESEFFYKKHLSNNIIISSSNVLNTRHNVISEPVKTINSLPVDKQKLVVRFQNGIQKWKMKIHNGWWECGEEYKTKDEKKDAALRWAVRIVQLSDKYSDESTYINPWGLLGLVANESGFDRCAVGPSIREWAYRSGAFTKQRGGAISHSVAQFKSWIFSKRVLLKIKRKGFDVGPMQELWTCNKKRRCRSIYWNKNEPSVDFSDMFTMTIQFDSGVKELRRRAKLNKTDRSWATWRNGRCLDWYDKKIVRWSRIMGSRKGEI